MVIYLAKRKATASFKAISLFVITAFIFTTLAVYFPFKRTGYKPVPTDAYASALPYMPAPTQLVNTSPHTSLPILKGIQFYAGDPFKFNFIIDEGDKRLEEVEFKKEANKLIKYFLSSLTIPEKDLWVNLSPYEKDRITPPELGNTEMGKDLLGQDYILKQLTSSLTYPESPLGKRFWKKVYQRALTLFGTTKIPINTFNKIWIVPDKAVVYEEGNKAYVGETKLKVLLEEDYIALQKNINNLDKPNKISVGTGHALSDIKDINNFASQITKEIILPVIEEEVNKGANFAYLRQIYNSLILATWFKQRLRQSIEPEHLRGGTEAKRSDSSQVGEGSSILSKLYIDKKKTKGIDVNDPQIKQKIYNQYLEAYKKGVYNYIKVDSPQSIVDRPIKRRYYSGGANLTGISSSLAILPKPKSYDTAGSTLEIKLLPWGEKIVAASPLEGKAVFLGGVGKEEERIFRYKVDELINNILENRGSQNLIYEIVKYLSSLSSQNKKQELSEFQFLVERFKNEISRENDERLFRSFLSLGREVEYAREISPEVKQYARDALKDDSQLNNWKFDGVELYAVHAQRQPIDKFIKTSLQRGSLRNTTHFFLNNIIKSAGVYGNWEDADYIAVVPVKDLVQVNPGQIIGGLTTDLFFWGNVELPSTAKIFTSRDEAKNYLSSVTELRPQGMWAWGDSWDITNKWSIFMAQKGLYCGSHGDHWTDKIASKIGKDGSFDPVDKSLPDGQFGEKYTAFKQTTVLPQDWGKFDSLLEQVQDIATKERLPAQNHYRFAFGGQVASSTIVEIAADIAEGIRAGLQGADWDRERANDFILKQVAEKLGLGEDSNFFVGEAVLTLNIRRIDLRTYFEPAELERGPLEFITYLLKFLQERIKINAQQSRGQHFNPVAARNLDKLEIIKKQMLEKLAINRNNLPFNFSGEVLKGETSYETLIKEITANPDKLYLIIGPPGAGKSTFTQNLRRRLEKRNVKVRVIKRDNVYYNKEPVKEYDVDTVYIIEGYPDIKELVDGYRQVVSNSPDNMEIVSTGYFTPYDQARERVKRRGRQDKSRRRDIDKDASDATLLQIYQEIFDEWYLEDDFSQYKYMIMGETIPYLALKKDELKDASSAVTKGGIDTSTELSIDSDRKKGGIDLNPDNMDMEIRQGAHLRQGYGGQASSPINSLYPVRNPASQIPTIFNGVNFQGFTFQIIKIQRNNPSEKEISYLP